MADDSASDQPRDAQSIQKRIDAITNRIQGPTISRAEWQKLYAEREALKQKLAALKEKS